MNRNLIIIVVGVLGIGAGALGYWFYQERHRSGVDITIGGRGVSIQER
ncbi:hypothetical protein J5Y09_21600 [Roseomonas sp. PWR1]|uniref:Uncharacterized protein n=1 Tax=Roseomonas nitratireducens TaxID=2820810 RepID=A0ABS4AYT4_9PROT|nr:hypothetical protein [Neoroseomonas nitratireducens]MBP0466539.1 hypothetical protein [Neoroseomonas nitratireducens]